ncbi:MAG: hypothetical protein QG574_1791, partial [Cyanobacteriota bacterium erpe_2018_sw_21hr_WHONDRS-SW48-000092_B_bin.40]|nr:hypothetical protein [Cyanobacteriota bacterium erpe_2018_sw_21hr_WHONDRS-SW48-000092_B_bin.40]
IVCAHRMQENVELAIADVAVSRPVVIAFIEALKKAAVFWLLIDWFLARVISKFSWATLTSVFNRHGIVHHRAVRAFVVLYLTNKTVTKEP